MKLSKKVTRPTIQNPTKITDKKIKTITGYDPEILTDPNGLEVKVTPVMMFVPDDAITDQLTGTGRFIPNAVNRLIDRALNNNKHYVFDYDKEDLYLLNACLESGGKKANEHLMAVLNDGELTVGTEFSELAMQIEFGLTELIKPDSPMAINIWRWVKTGIGKGFISWNGTDQPMTILEGPGYKVIFSALWDKE